MESSCKSNSANQNNFYDFLLNYLWITFGKSSCRYLSWKWTITLYSFLFTKVGLLSRLKLAPGGICCLWCGGWAYSGMGAFAFSCPLSLHCVFCTVAQLLGLVFPSLPVFASGGWGVSVGDCFCFKVVRPSGPGSPVQADSGVLGVFGEVYGKCEKEFFLFWPD